MALWAVFLLGALAVAVSAYVSAAAQMAGVLAARTGAAYLARAGIEGAVSLVMADTNGWDSLTEPWSTVDLSITHLGTGSATVRAAPVGWDGGTIFPVGLVDEERKVNINKASQPLLAAVMKRVGGCQEDAAAQIAACIVDWRDNNDDVQVGGAERAYYEGLQPPYACHNDPFDLIEELRLVKGMSDALYERIEGAVTVFGSGRVNLNTADADVLGSLAESMGSVDDTVADGLVRRIVDFRQSAVFESRGQIPDAIPGLSADERLLLSRMVSAGLVDVSSRHFGGVAEGRYRGAQTAQRRIWFVFDRTNGRIRAWYED